MDLFKRDEPFEKDIATPFAWNSYLVAGIKFLALFYILTLAVEVYVFSIHRGQYWELWDIGMVVLYLFTVILSLTRLIKKLPFAAIMLASPTIPLFMLVLVVSSIPVVHLIGKLIK
jgi:hypothetical protein